MSYIPPLYGHKTYGLLTQTAATPIVRMLEPKRNAITVITALEYINAADVHTITIMRALGSTTFAADAAASQAAVVLTADPGNYAATWSTSDNLIAAGDYVVYRCADGTYRVDTVASGSGTTPTLTTNLPTLGVVAGDPLWFFGIKTDTNPGDAQAHPTLRVPSASSGQGYLYSKQNAEIGLFGALGFYEPVLVFSDNVTTQGYLTRVDVAYTDRPGPNRSNCTGTSNV